ncbi:hypothetical protein L7F22_023050 [Adiantum nelumboides]|nr:hypothetical protein [Adiantum nelumboides]
MLQVLSSQEPDGPDQQITFATLQSQGFLPAPQCSFLRAFTPCSNELSPSSPANSVLARRSFLLPPPLMRPVANYPPVLDASLIQQHACHISLPQPPIAHTSLVLLPPTSLCFSFQQVHLPPTSQRAGMVPVHDVQIEGLDPGHWEQEATMDVDEEHTPSRRTDTKAKGKSAVLSLDDRWRKVSSWCKDEKVNKSPLQCRDKWENTFPKYKKIRDWDKAVPSGKNSFELMSVDERLEGGFPRMFDMNVCEILESRFGSDVLVNPGPILVDTSSEILGDNVNMGSTSAPSVSPPPGMQFNTSTDEATPSDPSSTGKRRSS